MKALILAGGYGTRLASVAKNTPKPLLTISGKALIDFAVEKLKPVAGLSEIVVVTNNKFYENFLQWAKTHTGVKIRVINDGTNTNEERLGSVGDINYVWDKEIAADDWLVIGGDNLFDQALEGFMSFARSKTPAMTIGLYDIGDIKSAVKFGVCALDQKGKVISFQEKPLHPASSWIAMCLYYFPKETLVYIEEYHKGSNALDAAGSYIKWLSEKKNVYGFQFSGKWYDIGSIESLEEARAHFLKN